MSFIFGGDTGLSYGDLARKRKIAQSLAKQGAGTPRNVGEGLAAIGRALAYRTLDRKIRDAEAHPGYNAAADVNYRGVADVVNGNRPVSAGVLEALRMGVPSYARGTMYHPGGPAVVGEYGPEVVNMPPGSQVQPYQGMTEGQFREFAPAQPEQYNPDMMPGDGADPRGMFWQEDSRFDDANAYQVADASGQLPGLGDQFAPRNTVSGNDLAKREIAARNALNGLQQIYDELRANPSLLEDAHTYTGKGKENWLAFRDKLGIEAFDISPEQEQYIADNAAYRQKLLTNVNQYIKDITGAQVGQGQETKRLMAVQPNAGDSPTQLMAKLEGAMEMGRINAARLKYQLDGGKENAPTDAEIRQILTNRGRELYEQALKSGLSPTDARMQAAGILSEEFGL